MKLPFLNRVDELRRVRRLLAAPEPSLTVIYGRRRCGKSRFLQQLGGKGIVYYLADQSDVTLQLATFAAQFSRMLPGFDTGTYHTWHAVFNAINARNFRHGKKPVTIILDEFPYLAAESPALPSLLQKMIDTSSLGIHLVLSGSSQRMMKGLVLDETAPLYGRAREIIKVRPLKAGWICDALHIEGARAIEEYAVWGGVPRYWELAAEYADPIRAIRELVLHRDGVLHNEPRRLLLDDMRSDTQPHSALAVIGSGVHRISEISARLGKPAMNLLRSLEVLVELGLVRRDIPFGEPEKNSKRTLYTIADSFLRFWYRYVFPNLSALEQELYDGVLSQWDRTKDQFIGAAWEDLARESAPHLSIGGRRWKQARRWWGRTGSGEMGEIDIVAESIDGEAILLGEAKWGDADALSQCERMETIASGLPFIRGKRIVTACWVGNPEKQRAARQKIVTPEKVLRVLR